MTLPTVTVADADAYFLTTPRNAEWAAIADHQIWLNEAQRLLGELCFDEDKECCGKKLTDVWTGVVSELALALQKNPTAITGGGSSKEIKSASLGGLSVTYADGASSSTKVSTKAPLVLQAFPWLVDSLSCWLKISTGSSRILSRCC